MKSVKKMTGLSLFFATALAALASSACVVSTSGGGGTVAGAGAPTQFVISNQSAEAICYVNVSPTSSSNWGPDQLGPSEVIHPGYQRSWTIPADYYDFRLQDCGRRTMMERRQVAVSGTGVEITFRVRE